VKLSEIVSNSGCLIRRYWPAGKVPRVGTAETSGLRPSNAVAASVRPMDCEISMNTFDSQMPIKDVSQGLNALQKSCSRIATSWEDCGAAMTPKHIVIREAKRGA
jgi:hypothetical protein